MVWQGMGMVWYGMVWHGMVWYAVRCFWYCIAWQGSGIVWNVIRYFSGMWYGISLYGTRLVCGTVFFVWYGMVWYIRGAVIWCIRDADTQTKKSAFTKNKGCGVLVYKGCGQSERQICTYHNTQFYKLRIGNSTASAEKTFCRIFYSNNREKNTKQKSRCGSLNVN